MSYNPINETQTHAVNLRIRHDIRNLIDRAAKTQGDSRRRLQGPHRPLYGKRRKDDNEIGHKRALLRRGRREPDKACPAGR